MVTFHPTFRTVFTAWLAISVAGAGTCPCAAFGSHQSPTCPAHSGGESCCCSTEGSGRCGAACCGQLPNKSERLPAPDRAKDRGEAFGLVGIAIVSVVTPDMTAPRGHVDLGDTSHSNLSLVALGVRLNC